MLNRTNRTLSAHLNRLNLGTRSLAPQASCDNGAKSLHARHAYPVVMRAGTVRVPAVSISTPIPGEEGWIGASSIPGSPSVSSWLTASCEIQPRVVTDADTLAAAAWPDRDCLPIAVVPCRRRVDVKVDVAVLPASGWTRPSPERFPGQRPSFTGRRRPQRSRLAVASTPVTLGPVAASFAAAGG